MLVVVIFYVSAKNTKSIDLLFADCSIRVFNLPELYIIQVSHWMD